MDWGPEGIKSVINFYGETAVVRSCLCPGRLLYRSNQENPGGCACQCDGCQDRESPVKAPGPVQDESGDCRKKLRTLPRLPTKFWKPAVGPQLGGPRASV